MRDRRLGAQTALKRCDTVYSVMVDEDDEEDEEDEGDEEEEEDEEDEEGEEDHNKYLLIKVI